ncbi:hypothetical protein B0H13DRAFT_2262288 [Mycena leptocephala]|nr:hypothetical protein B0H13DRAFT_2262288 [Mycena leptocephala]
MAAFQLNLKNLTNDLTGFKGPPAIVWILTNDEYDGLIFDKKYTSTRIVPYRGILFDMITLARENNIVSALPCAYYRALHTHVLHTVFDGIPRGGGTTAFLAPVDQRRTVLGRDVLLRAQAKHGYTWGWLCSEFKDGDNGKCTDPQICTPMRTQQLRKYHDTVSLWALSRSPSGSSSYCASCCKNFQESSTAGREKIWNELPGFFGLPSWAKLTNNL